jgi:AraC-like DNA-binding protein
VRLQHAMGMLGDTGTTVAEVADRCGFNDVTYFCRVFKQQLGVTPSQFRKRG